MTWRPIATPPSVPPRVNRDYFAVVELTDEEKEEDLLAIHRLMRAHGFESDLPGIGGQTLKPFKNIFMLKRSLLSMDSARTLVTEIFKKTPYRVRWFIAEVVNIHWSPE